MDIDGLAKKAVRGTGLDLHWPLNTSSSPPGRGGNDVAKEPGVSGVYLPVHMHEIPPHTPPMWPHVCQRRDGHYLTMIIVPGFLVMGTFELLLYSFYCHMYSTVKPTRKRNNTLN